MADITITFTLFGVFSITLVTANPELVALSIVAVVVIVIEYVVCQKPLRTITRRKRPSETIFFNLTVMENFVSQNNNHNRRRIQKWFSCFLLTLYLGFIFRFIFKIYGTKLIPTKNKDDISCTIVECDFMLSG